MNTTMEGILNVAGLIVGVATLAVVLQSRNTASVIRASFSGFSSALRAASGR